ncbi:MAG: peptidoglycan DD-metalloendopeptidase family protein [Candidatus Korobacteraceae bacterium]
MKRWVGILFVLGLCAAVSIGMAWQMRAQSEALYLTEVQAALQDLADRPKPDTVSETTIRSGSTFVQSLQLLGIDSLTAHTIVEAARPIFDFRRVRQGNKLSLAHSYEGELRAVRYAIDDGNELWIRPEEDGFRAELLEIPSTVETVGLRGELRSSLFESILAMGETPDLAVRLADIFQWDLDFYRDPQPGDTFRLVVEKKQYANGVTASYGRILTAEYVNAGRTYSAVLFRDPAGRPAYYSADGKSLQKSFLRSPLRFQARVSSHFSRNRLHPVLRTHRAHLGTDYAAPTGTPVQAVANGRVVWSGRKGGNGILVQIAHPRGYQSYYLHLSRALVRRGQNVIQGQTVGRVGSTGLASGPHLDFRIQRNGQFVNWERMQLPPAEPVAKADLAAFSAERDRWMAMLPIFETTQDKLASSSQTEVTGGATGTP